MHYQAMGTVKAKRVATADPLPKADPKAVLKTAETLFETIAARPDASAAFSALAKAAAHEISPKRTARMHGELKKLGLSANLTMLGDIRGGTLTVERPANRQADQVPMLFAYVRDPIDHNNTQVTGVAITASAKSGKPQVTHFCLPMQVEDGKSVTRSVAHFLAGGVPQRRSNKPQP